jgi:hypothetical protein
MKQNRIKKEWKKEEKSVNLSVLKKEELQSICGGEVVWKYINGSWKIVNV